MSVNKSFSSCVITWKWLFLLAQRTKLSRRSTASATAVTKYVSSMSARFCLWNVKVIRCIYFSLWKRQDEDGNSRHASLSEEEENLAVLRRWAALSSLGWVKTINSLCSMLSPSSCCVRSHVMNELLETERAYVEELLCVLQVLP